MGEAIITCSACAAAPVKTPTSQFVVDSNKERNSNRGHQILGSSMDLLT